MQDTAFYLAIAGLIALILTLPIHMVVKERMYTWGGIIVSLNLFAQSFMVLKEISLPYIAMPNVVLLAYLLWGISYNVLKQK
ncbi:hypothetical protein GF369_02525 [Candidatus Peregrinibacteria bacterium]|nr:hypothetical protein [Candidatus Peregrinibacteria bacterium]